MSDMNNFVFIPEREMTVPGMLPLLRFATAAIHSGVSGFLLDLDCMTAEDRARPELALGRFPVATLVRRADGQYVVARVQSLTLFRDSSSRASEASGGRSDVEESPEEAAPSYSEEEEGEEEELEMEEDPEEDLDEDGDEEDEEDGVIGESPAGDPTNLEIQEREKKDMTETDSASEFPTVMIIGNQRQWEGTQDSASMRALMAFSKATERKISIREFRNEPAEIGRNFKNRLYVSFGMWPTPFCISHSELLYGDWAMASPIPRIVPVALETGIGAEGLQGTVVRGPRGEVVAWLHKSNAYLYFPYTPLPRRKEWGAMLADILLRIAQQVPTLIKHTRDLQALKKIIKEFEEETRARQEEAIAELCEQRKRDLRMEVHTSLCGVAESRKLLADAITKMVEAKRRLQEADKIDHAKFLADEMRDIRLDSRIAQVSLLPNGTFAIRTVPVEISYKDDRYSVGTFDLMIPMDPHESIMIYNAPDSVRGSTTHVHPHISPNGTPCLGNMSEILDPMRHSGKISAVVMGMMEFLWSVNPSGWYVTVEYWPKTERKSA